jgi:hypothetical protein
LRNQHSLTRLKPFSTKTNIMQNLHAESAVARIRNYSHDFDNGLDLDYATVGLLNDAVQCSDEQHTNTAPAHPNRPLPAGLFEQKNQLQASEHASQQRQQFFHAQASATSRLSRQKFSAPQGLFYDVQAASTVSTIRVSDSCDPHQASNSTQKPNSTD